MFRYTFFFLIACGCSASAERAAFKEDITIVTEGIRVEVASVSAQLSTSSLQFTGEVRGARDATLGSATGGLIEAVRVQPGQTVRQGQTLVTIDRALVEARLTQIQARAKQADRDYVRLQQLGDNVAKAQVERAETESIVANAAVAEAKELFKRASIMAPFSGTVADVNGEVGEIALPGVPIIHMVSTDPVFVRISVSDRDIVALKEGLSVRVNAASRPQVFQGKLTQIRTAANPKTRAFLADVSVPNPDQLLLPGMIAQVQVDVDLGQQIVLAQDWLVMNGDRQGVFLSVDGHAVWKDIKLGQVLGNQVVVEGLAEGDEVIFNGHRNLLDGDAIIISRKARCCEAGRPVFE